MEIGNNDKVLYLNPAQWLSYQVKPKHEISIDGRGTGKTTGKVALRIMDWAEAMPRGVIGLVGDSYMQLFTRILPGIIKGWNDMGWIEGRDYWIGGYAPKTREIMKPFKPPVDTKYFIHTRHGSGVALLSQDRPGMSNGVDLVALVGDEAKFLNKQRIDDEIIPAMRGEAHLFGNLWCYHGTLFTSDMPRHASGEWLLNVQGSPAELIQDIIQMQNKLWELESKFDSMSDVQQDRYSSVMKALNSALNNARAACTLVANNSSLTNLHILGEAWLKHMLNTLSKEDFQASILGIRTVKSKESFYPALDMLEHSYAPKPTQKVLDLGYNFTGLSNHDFQLDEESEWPISRLHIAIDPGGNFNCLVVGVTIGSTVYIIKQFYEYHPKLIKDVVLSFKEYYKSFGPRNVTFYYDHTCIARRAETDENISSIVIDTLESDVDGKWNVTAEYLGQTPTYKWRYEQFDLLFKGESSYFSSFKYNRMNANDWYESSVAADVKQIGNKLEKDKSSEKRSSNGSYKVAAHKATHLSDAGDTLLSGMIKTISEQEGFAW